MAPKRQTKEPAESIPSTAVTAMARQAGVKMLSSLARTEARGVLSARLDSVVRYAEVLAEHARRKTVSAEDMQAALDRAGMKTYSTGQEAALKRCAPLTGKGPIAQIKAAQKMASCAFIPPATFDRLVRSWAKADTRWSPDAMGLLQQAIERDMVSLMESVNLAAIHAGRVQLMPKDFQLVRRILGRQLA